MFDELMVAPPNAGRRHKRDLFPVKHTVWTKDKEESPFNYDTLKGQYLKKNNQICLWNCKLIKCPLFSNSEDNADLTVIFLVPVPDFVDKLKLDVKKKTAQKQSHRRKKRQYRSPRIEPELLLFVDHALFRAFEGDSNELLEYLLHFWHSVSIKRSCIWFGQSEIKSMT